MGIGEFVVDPEWVGEDEDYRNGAMTRSVVHDAVVAGDLRQGDLIMLAQTAALNDPEALLWAHAAGQHTLEPVRDKKQRKISKRVDAIIAVARQKLLDG